MKQYILINRIQVQNANAVAGFTWGFPAITHFLGYTHNLSRKLNDSAFSKLRLCGCAVIAHSHHIHVYGKYGDSFTQSRNPPYLHSHDKAAAPPVIEEGKMNMTVSLLIGCQGNIGNQANDFIAWLEKQCHLQRLAGGTVLDIAAIQLCHTESSADRHAIKRALLPGFILMDRADSLEKHYETLKEKDPDTELLDAWLDFSAFKQQARPKSDLIDKHLHRQFKKDEEGFKLRWQDWLTHLAYPYDRHHIPGSLKRYFSGLESNKQNKKLLDQWQQYLEPSEKTPADWERLSKPEAEGYLVPIMNGYKAITPVYQNEKIANTRDSETPVCFVEAVHSIGEWRGVHRLRSAEDFTNALWHYHHEEHWYLCRQTTTQSDEETTITLVTSTDDDYSQN